MKIDIEINENQLRELLVKYILRLEKYAIDHGYMGREE